MKNSFLICFHLIGRDRWSLGYQDNLVSVTNGSVFLPGTSCHLPWEQTWDTVLGLAVNGEIFFCLQSLRIAFERHCAVVNTGRILKLFSFFVARFFWVRKMFCVICNSPTPAFTRSRKEARKNTAPQAPEGAQPCLRACFGLQAARAKREQVFGVFNGLVYGELSRQG